MAGNILVGVLVAASLAAGIWCRWYESRGPEEKSKKEKDENQ